MSTWTAQSRWRCCPPHTVHKVACLQQLDGIIYCWFCFDLVSNVRNPVGATSTLLLLRSRAHKVDSRRVEERAVSFSQRWRADEESPREVQST